MDNIDKASNFVYYIIRDRSSIKQQKTERKNNMTQLESTSVQNYLTWMISGESDAAAVCLIITIIFAIGILTALLAGIRRGIFRQLLHTVITGAALVASYMATAEVLNAIPTAAEGMTTTDILTATSLNTLLSERLVSILSFLDS